MSWSWNPWHGCHKISPGCAHCYVYRHDARYERDPAEVRKNADFGLPVRRDRNGHFKIPPGELVYTCFTSDFFLEDADAWRKEAWDMIRMRDDLSFFWITKRIHRFSVNLPADWGEGYPHVSIATTVENQDRADFRMPLYLAAPIRHKSIVCEPLLERINLTPYLSEAVEQVTVGGESGNEARVCRYEWVLDIREQCRQRGIPFHFKQTGALFEKDGHTFRVPREHQHKQAKKAGIDLS
jgi:protein gp37